MKEEKKKPTFYVCDPSKNIKCEKGSCYINGGPCKHTTDKNYSRIGTLPIPYEEFIKEENK